MRGFSHRRSRSENRKPQTENPDPKPRPQGAPITSHATGRHNEGGVSMDYRTRPGADRTAVMEDLASLPPVAAFTSVRHRTAAALLTWTPQRSWPCADKVDSRKFIESRFITRVCRTDALKRPPVSRVGRDRSRLIAPLLSCLYFLC